MHRSFLVVAAGISVDFYGDALDYNIGGLGKGDGDGKGLGKGEGKGDGLLGWPLSPGFVLGQVERAIHAVSRLNRFLKFLIWYGRYGGDLGSKDEGKDQNLDCGCDFHSVGGDFSRLLYESSQN